MSLHKPWPSISRICRSTAINSPDPALAGRSLTTANRSPRHLPRAWGILFAVITLLGGCSDVPPIAKVGLLAPFEGLYRESGYGALSALRGALEHCAPPGVALVPLALDSGSTPDQARRAAEKMTLDPTVAVVVGPLDLASAASAAAALDEIDLPWIVPALISPAGGYAPRPDTGSVAALVAALLDRQTPPPARLLIAGSPPGLPLNGPAQPQDGTPVLRIDPPAALLELTQPGDAILWLGTADAGADLYNQLAAAQRALPFWLGPATAGAVFAAHAGGTGEVYWLLWQKGEGKREEQGDTSARSAAYTESKLFYEAACAALATLETAQPPNRPLWEPRAYRLNGEGIFIPYE